MRFLTKALLATALAAGPLMGSGVAEAQDVKIGFIVKQPEEPWFQDEWKFADQAANSGAFGLAKIIEAQIARTLPQEQKDQ